MGKNTQSQKTGSSDVLKSSVTREFSSGGVVFKNNSGQILWLVRKTAASELYPKQYWMLPKGRIDDAPNDQPGPIASGKIKADSKSLEDAAIREVKEEGGIDAKIIRKIGTSMYSFTDPKAGRVLKFVTFYLMEYIKDLSEGFCWETAEVVWLPFNEAKKQLSFSGEKQVLVKAKELLSSVSLV